MLRRHEASFFWLYLGRFCSTLCVRGLRPRNGRLLLFRCRRGHGARHVHRGAVRAPADARQEAKGAGARARATRARAARAFPTPARFAFAFGRPDILAERQAERLAKWQWSDEFLAKARPDKGNYGQGDLFDDGLTKLERAQIEQGREAYLTGGAKLRYKRLTGQI